MNQRKWMPSSFQRPPNQHEQTSPELTDTEAASTGSAPDGVIELKEMDKHP